MSRASTPWRRATAIAHAADVGGIEADAPFLFALLGEPLWSWPTVKLLLGQVRKRGLRGLAGWFGQALAPARGWLETRYHSSDWCRRSGRLGCCTPG